MIAAATVATAAILCAPLSARAAEVPNPTAQAEEYGMAWIPFIRPEDQPARRYAVCLVDTGVNVTPDTPSDDPAGPIVFRGALDGGSGLGANDPAHLHGTRMAMTMSATVNDWGQVGTWPGVPILSVRAMGYDQAVFVGDDYRRGVNWCLRPSVSPVAVINLSLGCDCTLTGQPLAELEDGIVDAHSDGVSVVAAAGNRANQGVQAPANAAGAFAVAAGGAGGQLCSYASYDARVAAIGPGCGMHLADAVTGEPQPGASGGASSAAASVSAVIALLRSYRPQSTWAEVEGWVRQGTRQIDGRPVLDAAGAARAAGLGAIVDRAEAALAAADRPGTGPVPSTQGPADPGGRAIDPEKRRAGELPLPRVSARWRSRVLLVQVRNLPAGAMLKVVALRHGRREFSLRRVAQRTRAASSVRMRLPRPPDRVQVQFVETKGNSSSLIELRRRRNGAYGP